MKVGNKLALAVAVLAASSATYAMDAMNDDALSDTTGQSGLTITTNLPAAGITGTFVYTDFDGSTGTAGTGSFATSSTFSGDVLAGFKLTGDPLVMTLDAGATSTGAANLLIDVKTGVTNGLAMTMTSNLQACATSNDPLGVCSAPSNLVAFVGNPAITLKNLDVQILLGAANATQHMIQATMASAFNLTIGNATANNSPVAFGILDPNQYVGAATEGGIGMSELNVSFAAGTQVNIDACNGTTVGGGSSCTASTKGLLIGFGASTAINVNMYNVVLGNIGTTTPSTAIGNVALYGMNLAGTTVQIAGH